MGGSIAAARVLGFPEALAVVLHHAAWVGAPEAERVLLPLSAGRVLAEEVRADRDQPPFDRATRDGFAVRAEDWSSGHRLKIAGQVRAGQAAIGGAMAEGLAIEIMTGAAVPAGADAVAMVEHVEQAGGEVWAASGRRLAAGENIARRAEEARRDELLLRPGTAIGAAEIALAAACGHAELAVRKRPTVAIAATGDELTDLDRTPEAHRIRNSNGYALAALVEAAGGRAKRLPIARDTREELRERIAEALKTDLMLLSGGVSVGKYDLVKEVLAEFGAEFFFAGVRMQPGRPLVFGRLRKSESAGSHVESLIGTDFGPTASAVKLHEALPPEGNAGDWIYFFGLPGNPISTQVTFQCLAAPMLRAICGAGVAGPKFVQATLALGTRGKAGLTRFLPAILRHDLELPKVTPVGPRSSGDLAANARANCYAVLPEGRDFNAGDVISVLLR